jgi:hypothetical protein
MGNRLKKICTLMHPIRTQLEKMAKNFLNNSLNPMVIGNLSRYMPVKRHKKGAYSFNLCKPLIFVVRQAGFEPAAYGFVVRRSIRAELLALAKAFEI